MYFAPPNFETWLRAWLWSSFAPIQRDIERMRNKAYQMHEQERSSAAHSQSSE